MKDKILYALLFCAVGFVLCLFIMPKSPSVDKKKDVIYVTSKTSGTTTITVKVASTITGATGITLKPDGEITASGTNLSIGSQSQTSATIVTHTEIQYKEIKTEKIINYSGSAFVMFDNLTLIPSDVGISYNIINPISLVGQYAIEQKKIKFGLMLQF